MGICKANKLSKHELHRKATAGCMTSQTIRLKTASSEWPYNMAKNSETYIMALAVLIPKKTPLSLPATYAYKWTPS
jgi:hypothetical protein